jgi:hypothetical protein
MTERRPDPFESEDNTPQPGEGRLPGIDLHVGGPPQTSGDDNLATYDEENMYGNDVIVEEDIYDDPDLTDEPMEPNTRVVDEPF